MFTKFDSSSPLSEDRGPQAAARQPKSSIFYASRLSSIFNSFPSDPYLWLALLLSLPVIGPLLQPGYFWGAHDARHSVYFLYQFDKAIRDGVWYPRWAPDFAFGYGYPFFNIYGPLSSYVSEAFHLAGLDIVTAVKVVFGLSALLSGLTMYLFVRRLLGPRAGLIAALTYVYLPYHLFDLYVRAALAESVGFVFVPLLLWGFYEAVTHPRLTVLLWAAAAYAGLMFTSNLLALLFTPLLGLYVAYMLLGNLPLSEWPATRGGGHRWRMTAKRDELSSLTPHASRFLASSLPPAFVLLLGLGLSAIFWLPAFLEYRYVRVDQWVGGRFAFGDDFVEFFQLFSPRWGFGASIPGPDDQAGFQIGLAATILFIFSFLVVPKLANTAIRRTLYFFQGMTLLILFLTTPISYPVWTFLPLSTFAQFPWRLLVVVAPFISVVAGAIMAGENGQQPKFNSQQSTVNGQLSTSTSSPTTYYLLPTTLLSCLILLSSYPYLQTEVRDPRPTEGPVSQAALFRFQQSSDEMTGQTAWVERIPNWSTLAEQVERGGEITTKVNYTALPPDDSVGVYSMQMDSVHELLWVGTQKEGQVVTFLIPYYPGWQATLYEDLGPHDGNLDEEVGPVTRVGPVVARPQISTTPIEGWMVVPIPPGSHFLEIRFEDTPVRILGRWISLLSVLLVVSLFIFDKFVLMRKAQK
ncbi:MAG: glycosyltransferase family 39 protein [Anaerolineales bacterium]|nr:glycosyltransferase family 39 protein [Anaerolineales bacterium]